MFNKFTQWFDRPPPQNTTPGKKCDFPGCEAMGKHRAPKSRRHLQQGQNDWYWFCLVHVRDYNATWNYYSGMSETEVLQENLDDVTWQRPTWPLGEERPNVRKIKDPFGFFFTEENQNQSFHEVAPLMDEERQALQILGLSYPFTKEELQKTYRSLAKLYHPDANQDTVAEIKIRQINQAYMVLKNRV